MEYLGLILLDFRFTMLSIWKAMIIRSIAFLKSFWIASVK